MAKFLLVEPFGPTAIWAIRTVRFADSALVDLRNYYTHVDTRFNGDRVTQKRRAKTFK